MGKSGVLLTIGLTLAASGLALIAGAAMADGEAPFWLILGWVLFLGAIPVLVAAVVTSGWRVPRRKGANRTSTPRQVATGPSDAAAESSPLLKATRTNDGHFPRIESAVDSLGHSAERLANDQFYARTDHVLKPGQQVTFELEATDPNGDDLELSVITPAKGDADVTISDGIVTWNVRNEDIADPAHVHIYVASQRSYHRHTSGEGWDDAASFIYRVLPRA